MAFNFTHVNFNVLDLARSMAFYEKAFGFREKRRLEAEGFTLVYLTDGTEMGIICYENAEMGIYFVEDPDGYWIEVLPKNM